MKNGRRLLVLILGLGLIVLGSRTVAARAEEAGRLEKLRRGEILTQGGLLAEGAWGKMEGVIQAPPHLVWKLFIDPDNWKKFKLPNLIDSRAADAQAVAAVSGTGKVEDFYRAIKGRSINATESRAVGGHWVGYTFQYYDLPWPLSNRWVVLKNDNDETRQQEALYQSHWERVGGNVRTLDGLLLLAPFEGDKNVTLLEYNIKSNPGSRVPKFILKWGLQKTMPEAIRAIRRAASQTYIKPAS